MESSHGGGGRQSAAVREGADDAGGGSPAGGKRATGAVSPAAARPERRCGGSGCYVTEAKRSSSGAAAGGLLPSLLLDWCDRQPDSRQAVGMVTELLISPMESKIPCGGRGFNAVRVTCLIGEDYGVCLVRLCARARVLGDRRSEICLSSSVNLEVLEKKPLLQHLQGGQAGAAGPVSCSDEAA